MTTMASVAGGLDTELNLATRDEVVTYLQEVVPLLVGGSEGDLYDTLSQPSTGKLIESFATNSSVPILSIQRNCQTLLEEEEEEEDVADTTRIAGGKEGTGQDNKASTAPAYLVSTEVSFVSSTYSGVVFMKRGAVLSTANEKPFPMQLRYFVHGEGQPFGSLYALVQHYVGPMINSAIKAQSNQDKMGIKGAKKALADMEASLSTLSQDTDIPDVQLAFHPAIRAAVAAASEAGREAKLEDVRTLIEDPQAVRLLDRGVVRWVREIQKVTLLDRDPSSGTAEKELSFWVNLEGALRAIESLQVSSEVQLTLEVLKAAGRQHVVTSFSSDTGLQNAVDTVANYKALIKDFPINGLLAAEDLESINDAIQEIFLHLRKIKHTKYPLLRASKLVQAISRDVNERLLKVLRSNHLMNVPPAEFERVYTGCNKVFRTWEEQDQAFLNVLRDLQKTRHDNVRKAPRRSEPVHKALQERLEVLYKFRREHEQLRNVIQRVIKPTEGADGEVRSLMNAGDLDVAAEVDRAYDDIRGVDTLDLTPEGGAAWDAARRGYDVRIDAVESVITERLREQLGRAEKAAEMFRIFSHFNALFVRPRIQGAIREYQTQLIHRVKEDIAMLHDKFKVQYHRTTNAEMSDIRDIPPISGQIIWAKQIDRQLSTYLRRVGDVLGKGWENHIEGRTLYEDGQSFRQKLDTNQLYANWATDMESRGQAMHPQGPIFDIEFFRGDNKLVLTVNFHEHLMTLFKEVRNLKMLNHRVGFVLANRANEAKRLYPSAISLKASVKTYMQTVDKLDARKDLKPLVASWHQEVQKRISQGISMTWSWDPVELEDFVYNLSDDVLDLQDAVDDLIVFDERLEKLVDKLDSIEYKADKFSSLLKELQHTIMEMKAAEYVNMDAWLASFDVKVEEVLARRLNEGLTSWCDALEEARKDRPAWDTDNAAALANLPTIKAMRHDIVLRNQRMFVNPPRPRARVDLLSQLQEHAGVITSLRRLHVTTEADAAEDAAVTTPPLQSKLHYTGLLHKLPGGDAQLMRAYGLVQGVISDVDAFVEQWLQYQTLWDVNTAKIIGDVDGDLERWQSMLTSLVQAQRAIETDSTSRTFGPIEVDFTQAQARVSLKYDSIQKELLNAFGSEVVGSGNKFFAMVHGEREKLESMSIHGANTSEQIAYIGLVQRSRKASDDNQKLMATLKSATKILERQRFSRPDDAKDIDHIESEWEAFRAILNKRYIGVQGEISGMQMKVVNEDRQIEQKIQDLVKDWDRKKPMGGDVNPDEAVNRIHIFEQQFLRLREAADDLLKAKDALDLEVKDDERLSSRIEELYDLKKSWAELSRTVHKLNTLKNTEWGGVIPPKVRSTLNEIVDEMRRMPARVKSYEAYDYLLKECKGYLRVNDTISVLKSGALKDRHWRELQSNLGVNWVMVDLTLGTVWAVDLLANESKFSEILKKAKEERALEEFLLQIKDAWHAYELELLSYQNKTHLIKGWDDLFTLAKDHITSLAQMRNSPYFPQFEEETNVWDQKLNAIYDLFYNVWIDVQRKWIYLEGIFAGSAELATLLPNETNKFLSVSNEFKAVMRNVHKSPKVLDVMGIPNLSRTIQYVKDALDNIQKALSKYLEQERSSFPRFYFVGDEDLLDIIGNSKNVDRIQTHFSKMFAGLNNCQFSEDKSTADGILAKEGEHVPYFTPVPVAGQKINGWLSGVEQEMKVSLAKHLAAATKAVARFRSGFDAEAYMAWLNQYQTQLVVLAQQVAWSEAAGAALAAGGGKKLDSVLDTVVTTLTALADKVLVHLPPIVRKKLEHMIIEMVHKRDVTRNLMASAVTGLSDFQWLSLMRFAFDSSIEDPLKQLTITMADATMYYGFEYLGLIEKLVQTPLTDRCFLTMTQALAVRQGGSPYGPAGTGKTESVKALGAQLGRFVLVFNCDEAFDNQAMGRIFVGLCQVGAWGCFDEFNRLEESMLSAVSQQIETIQLALKAGGAFEDPERARRAMTISLQGRSFSVNPNMATFITMNPGYAGRSPLPDNLKKLFRNLAMTKPDRQLIAQVMLYSQGFRSSELLSRKVVPLFILCDEQLSAQSHYDFGLRSLKAVLISAGNIKRDRLAAARQAVLARGESVNESEIAASINEQEVVIQSITQTMIPKLVAEDIPLLNSLLSDVFPGIDPPEIPLDALKAEIRRICAERHLVVGDMWLDKVLQVYQVTGLAHGLMLVGPSGVGKSTAWRVLMEALERLPDSDGQRHKSVSWVIDPKAITKDELYGSLDNTTREWTDGLFTHIVRKIISNHKGEANERHWIILDGDVDPEWVENLNSVLDDNKLLTLPNGERLSLPKNIRIIFEVQDLKNATLATVSRCGMVWFSPEVVTNAMAYEHFLTELRNVALSDGSAQPTEAEVRDMLQVQSTVADVFEPFFAEDGVVSKALAHGESLFHVMDYTQPRCLNALFSMLNGIPRAIFDYNGKSLAPMNTEQVKAYASKRFVYSLMWSLVGDSRGAVRREMGDFVRACMTVDMPPDSGDIIDFKVELPDGNWMPWAASVQRMEIDSNQISGTDVVVPTLDTKRHEDLLVTWLSEHLPIVLCGPPGSGKTMTLFSALRAMPQFDVAGLNFSSTTQPDLIMKTFEQYCELRRTPNGYVMAPAQHNKWLVIFMDECNLSAADKYDTVRVVTFVRQLVEQGGYWDTKEHEWVTLERIQFVGACNPPTDPGRVPLAHRFLRHIPVVYVDYPGPESLKQIYGTFNRAVLRPHPAVSSFEDALTDAMVDFYTQSQNKFTADMQPHYVYSPREMTRWFKGVHKAISPMADAGVPLTIEVLVRVWAHEALRLFSDRLVFEDERQWTEAKIDDVARAHFPPNSDFTSALARPILFSDWLSGQFESVEIEALREYVTDKLSAFTEQQLDLRVVLFDEVLDHVLRIDRVFRQNQGHMLLIGVSGCGRTTLSRFVASINNLSVVQVKTHALYTAADFDEDLRDVLRRSGVEGEKIVFIMDEGDIMDTAFLERMNTLLANGEVPGLFEGDDYSKLMSQCKEHSRKEGRVLDENDELYRWFSKNIMNNLHIVFTMCPTEGGMDAGAATTSPALFNRCVLDWFGDWSAGALFQVGEAFLEDLPTRVEGYEPPMDFPSAVDTLPQAPTFSQAISNACVYVHRTVQAISRTMATREGRSTFITPRHYQEFLKSIVEFYKEKRQQLENQKNHLVSGVNKIDETVVQVSEMQGTLAEKEANLQEKEKAANETLQLMLQEKAGAEEKKKESEKIGVELEVKSKDAEERRTIASEKLAKVEPLIAGAKEAVAGVTTKDVRELRALRNPPDNVKIALEGACILLGKKTDDWKTVLSHVGDKDFLNVVTNFDPDSVPSKRWDTVAKKLHTKTNDEGSLTAYGVKKAGPFVTFEKAQHASKVAGPLVKFVLASLEYSVISRQIAPLRKELAEIEVDVARMTKEREEIEELVQELEAKITTLTDDYAVLIAEKEAIKADLNTVSSKVTRSVQLLDSLGSEKERWSEGATDFDNQMATIVGDCLISAAFMGYAGYFDQRYRSALLGDWVEHMAKVKIPAKPGIEDAIPEYLSMADERMRWKRNSLPDDELCLQNAVMLKRARRYPLVIDPAGQAVEFILKEDPSVKVTSFLDPVQFRKDLESAVRFGTKLLVQDAGSYDSLLTPVINNEMRNAGGDTVVQIANKDIHYSSAFSMILTSNNWALQPAQDLCSRVTLINFTVTRGSLQTQCLNQVLRAERPDVEEKRQDLLKLQGEFAHRLLQLENDLLDALNKAEGSLLDDDKVVGKLELLKSEAAEVQRKVAETDVVMAEVQGVSNEYLPLSTKCSSIYFTLQQMHSVHFLYQYSLKFFLDIFANVVTKNDNLAATEDFAKRLAIITRDIFQVSYSRVAPGLLNEHRLSLALTFANFKLTDTDDALPHEELQYLLGGSNDVAPQKTTFDFLVTGSGAITQDRAGDLHLLSAGLAIFRKLADEIKGKQADFEAWLMSPRPEDKAPALTALGDGTKLLQSFRHLLLLQACRPDRFLAKARAFVEEVLGQGFTSRTSSLADAVEGEIDGATPVMLCGVKGFDTSVKIDDLAAQMGAQVISVAVGSAESRVEAKKALSACARDGRWLALKNVHLAPSLLAELEKQVTSLQPHPKFRLFLTTEINPKLPENILALSRTFMYEPPPGVKASLQRTLRTFSHKMDEEPTAQRGRVYLLLAWLHAVTQERLRYAPLGWSKLYEFGEPDLRTAADMIDAWVSSASPGGKAIEATDVPWAAIRTLLNQSIYGGRIDNEIDQRLLEAFVGTIFTERAFLPNFCLVEADKSSETKAIKPPKETTRQAMLAWAASLPDSQMPTWLGLPANAEMVLLANRAKVLVMNTMRLQTVADDSPVVIEIGHARRSDAAPQWMKTLSKLANTWLGLLPETLAAMDRTADSIRDPLFRFFDREVGIGANLLRVVRTDLATLLDLCAGAAKQTNYLQVLMADLLKGRLPAPWRKYKVPGNVAVNAWVADLALRLAQLSSVSKAAESGNGLEALRSFRVWTGGLFSPEAYITATRQVVAQDNKWALESLELELEMRASEEDTPSDLTNSFLVTGLRVEGAQCTGTTVNLSDLAFNVAPLTVLRWHNAATEEGGSKDKKKGAAAKKKAAAGKSEPVGVPLYLNPTRAELISVVKFEPQEKVPQSVFYRRAVAIMCSSLSGVME